MAHLSFFNLSAAENRSSTIAQIEIGSALIITDCASETRRHGKIPKLPAEINRMIIDCVLESLRSGDSTCATKLMHSSRCLRAQVARQFEPVTLYERDQTIRSRRIVNISRELSAFVWDSLAWWIEDFALRKPLKKPKGQPPSRPNSPDFLTALSGERIDAVSFSLEVTPHEHDEDMEELYDSKSYVNPQTSQPYICFSSDGVARALKHALGSLPSPRLFNMHARARTGMLDIPSGAIIELKMCLYVATSPPRNLSQATFNEHGAFVKTWRFDTTTVHAAD